MRYILSVSLVVLCGCAVSAQEEPPAPEKVECKLFTMGSQDLNMRSSGLSIGGGRGDGGAHGVILPAEWTPLNAVVVGNASYLAACRPKTEEPIQR
jgi:hypothetical protein